MLRNRPFAAAIIFFTLGLVLGLSLGVSFLLWVLCGSVLAAITLTVACFIFPARRRYFLLPLCLSAGLVYSCAYITVMTADTSFIGKSETVEARVAEISENYDNYTCVLKITGTSSALKGSKVLVYLEEEASAKLGSTVTASLTYTQIAGKYDLGERIICHATGSIVDVSDKPLPFLTQLSNSFTDKIEEMFSSYRQGTAGIASAVMTGRRDTLDTYTSTLFRNTGLSHLLALSGLHISIITMTIFTLLSKIGMSKKLCVAAVVIFGLGFAAFVGFTPSVSRSILMMLFVQLGSLFGIRTDRITSLLSALLLLLVINPCSIFSLSLQLSFLSCFGVVVSSERMARVSFGKGRSAAVVRAVVTPAVISFFAAICTIPVVMLKFWTFSYITIISNLIITPMFTYVLILLYISLGVFAVTGLPFAALPGGKILEGLIGIMEKLFVSDIGSVSTIIPTANICVLLVILMFFAVAFYRRKKLAVIIISLSVLFIVSFSAGILMQPSHSKKAVLEAENGWSQYIFLSQGDESVYIAMGGEHQYISCIYENGYVSLDKYVMTDLTENGVNKLERILNQMRVFSVCIPEAIDSINNTAIYARVEALAKARGCEIVLCKDTVPLYEHGTISFMLSENTVYGLIQQSGTAVFASLGKMPEIGSYFDAYYLPNALENSLQQHRIYTENYFRAEINEGGELSVVGSS